MTMKTKTIFVTCIFFIAIQNMCISQQCQSIKAQPKQTENLQRYTGRINIDEDMPLKEGLEDFNRYLPEPKLTEEEVIASIRRIKDKHPTIPTDVLAFYNRVINERILPRGMDFKTSSGWIIGGYRYEVDWRDLCLDAEHSGSSTTYGFRIRARFISSKLLTEEEKLERERPLMNVEKFMVDGKIDEEKMKNSPEYKKMLNEFEEFQKKKEEFREQKQTK